MKVTVLLTGFAICGVALAQTSASFTLEEYTFNAGGTPSAGTTLSSAGFEITLASIGDSVSATGLSSSSFQADLCFESAYKPPGEVFGLMLTDKQTLVWNAEPSAGVYNLYRDDASNGYGNCEEHDLPGTTTVDSAVPPTGGVFHYLVTVANRLAEEGTKGFRSDGTTERLGSFGLPACP